MNCAVHPNKNILAVGMDNKCQLLEVDTKEEVVENSSEKKGNKGRFVATKKRTFKITEKNSVVTVDDCSTKADDDGGFQKVVKFTADGEHVITGGSDGHVRILKVNRQVSDICCKVWQLCLSIPEESAWSNCIKQGLQHVI